MAILVRGHLTEPQNCILTAKAMVMGLFARMWASFIAARLTRCVFFKTGCVDWVQFLVLTPVSYHFIRVRADEIAFYAVEMGSFVLDCTWFKKKYYFLLGVSFGECFYPKMRRRRNRGGGRIRSPCIVENRRPLECQDVRGGLCVGQSAFCRRRNSRNLCAYSGSGFGVLCSRSEGIYSPR